jgi:hypothetical protein
MYFLDDQVRRRLADAPFRLPSYSQALETKVKDSHASSKSGVRRSSVSVGHLQSSIPSANADHILRNLWLPHERIDGRYLIEPDKLMAVASAIASVPYIPEHYGNRLWKRLQPQSARRRLKTVLGK